MRFARNPDARHWIEPDSFDMYRDAGGIILSMEQGGDWIKLACSSEQLNSILKTPKAGSLGVRFVFLFSLSKVSPLRIELRAEPHGEDATVKADAIKGRLCEGKLADLVLLDPKT